LDSDTPKWVFHRKGWIPPTSLLPVGATKKSFDWSKWEILIKNSVTALICNLNCCMTIYFWIWLCNSSKIFLKCITFSLFGIKGISKDQQNQSNITKAWEEIEFQNFISEYSLPYNLWGFWSTVTYGGGGGGVSLGPGPF
jgi:hypothetical protein